MPHRGALKRNVGCRRNRGGVLIVLLVLMTISLGLVGVWARSILQENRRMTAKLWRVQAIRLAEAGVRRAVALHALSEQFQEETWTVPAEQLDGKHGATVLIRAVLEDAGRTIQYQATTEYPTGATHRVRMSERITVPITSEGAQQEGSS